jgi:outer membrane protein TolC
MQLQGILAHWKKTASVLALVAGTTAPLAAQPPSSPPPPALACEAASPLPVRFSLPEAISQALIRQPTVRAAKASASAARLNQEVANSTLASLSGPQAKTRREQAALGVHIANANVLQVELETVNAVTRTYLAVIYAREQHKIAEAAGSRLAVTQEIARKLVDDGSKEVTASDVERLTAYRYLADARVNEAKLGIVRAKAALREAIGLEPLTDIEIENESLSYFYDAFKKHGTDHRLRYSARLAVLAAINQRPEIIQASLAADVTGLEKAAQCSTLAPYARTFAAIQDVHSRILPAMVMNGEYKPGPVGPEMPTHLAGTPCQRSRRAACLHERAIAVSEKARNLIALEVEEASARLEQEAQQIELLLEATKKTAKNAEDAERFFRLDQLKTDQLIAAQILDATTKAQLNDAYYKFGQALAGLQRATAGQLWECFEPSTEPDAPKAKSDDKAKTLGRPDHHQEPGCLPGS